MLVSQFTSYPPVMLLLRLSRLSADFLVKFRLSLLYVHLVTRQIIDTRCQSPLVARDPRREGGDLPIVRIPLGYLSSSLELWLFLIRQNLQSLQSVMQATYSQWVLAQIDCDVSTTPRAQKQTHSFSPLRVIRRCTRFGTTASLARA